MKINLLTLFSGMLFSGMIILNSCNSEKTAAEWSKVEAPEYFKARFETTKGNFEIESRKEWSPKAVNRLYQLIQSGFYQDMGIFRVVPEFVVQFGIGNDSALNNYWEGDTLVDEPVIKQNQKGVISFARGGKNSRSIQIFINLTDKNSPKLDTIFYNGVTGFPGIAEVTSGMEVIESFYGKYGDELGYKQDSIYTHGNALLKKNYPEIDYIIKSYIIED